jgi:hypothetical protein
MKALTGLSRRAGDGGKKARFTRESAKETVTPLRRGCRSFGLPVVTLLVCFFEFAREAAGAA